MVRYCIFDTETTGLPKQRNAKPEQHYLFPHVVQLSWLIYDDGKNTIDQIEDHIIKIPEDVEIPKVCSDIHGITKEISNEKGEDINEVLRQFTAAWLSCHILVGHNLKFDNSVLQAEYCRNRTINWLGRHRKIEYCTMKKGLLWTNFWLPSKFKPGTKYKKPPKLMELHQELFETIPNNLHNSMIDVFVTFRCLHQMIYERDIFDGVKHVELTDYYNNMCGL